MGIDNTDKYIKYRPKKFLGQNFLVDDNISKKIVKSLDITPEDFIIEIGPGYGSLTKHIIPEADDYLAVEIDKGITENLKNGLLKNEQEKNHNIISKDFLKFDFENDADLYNTRKKQIKISGNIPYNITTEVLFRLFENKKKISIAILMIQKEVANRLTAKKDTKEYGILAVMTQFNSDVKVLFNVPPTAFFPKPNVNSSVIELNFREEKYQVKDYELLRSLVRSSFGKRRKTMKNSLKDFFEKNKIDLKEINFDFSRRAENVSVEEFVTLANGIYGKIFKH
ncbi:MAG TPA: 16S rRNA (adenine(1518)-N(6)/adenine(1519)-N(6))-dimethyltransferase RsmA [Ignavibacteria bacterium]